MCRKLLSGDIFYANLNHGIGSEQSGYRPVLIIQNNMGNQFSPTVIVAAITGKIHYKASLPTHFVLDFSPELQSIYREVTKSITNFYKSRER